MRHFGRLEEKPTEKIESGDRRWIYVNRRLMSSGIIPWVRLGREKEREREGAKRSAGKQGGSENDSGSPYIFIYDMHR